MHDQHKEVPCAPAGLSSCKCMLLESTLLEWSSARQSDLLGIVYFGTFEKFERCVNCVQIYLLYQTIGLKILCACVCVRLCVFPASSVCFRQPDVLRTLSSTCFWSFSVQLKMDTCRRAFFSFFFWITHAKRFRISNEAVGPAGLDCCLHSQTLCRWSGLDCEDGTDYVTSSSRAIHEWDAWSSWFWFTGIHILLRVCVCVCMWESKRERQRDRELLLHNSASIHEARRRRC